MSQGLMLNKLELKHQWIFQAVICAKLILRVHDKLFRYIHAVFTINLKLNILFTKYYLLYFCFFSVDININSFKSLSALCCPIRQTWRKHLKQIFCSVYVRFSARPGLSPTQFQCHNILNIYLGDVLFWSEPPVLYVIFKIWISYKAADKRCHHPACHMLPAIETTLSRKQVRPGFCQI